MNKKRQRPERAESGESKRTPGSARTTSPTTGFTRATEFNPDYSYVRKDLKRIAILAASFIALLVVLAVFLR
jgi:hypothetical protein